MNLVNTEFANREAIEAGYRAAREQGVVCEVTGRTLLEIRGADTLRFLHNFSTADFRNRRPGEVVEAFLTTDQGRTRAFACVSLLETETAYLDVGRSSPEHVLSHLQKYAIADRVEFFDRTGEVRHFVLVGPAARERLESRFPLAADGEARACWQVEEGFVYEGGYPGTAACWHVVLADQTADPAVLFPELLQVPPSVLTAIQIEELWPESGIEVTDDHFPQEFRRDERAISFTKGCYLGQETVARIQTYGHVNRYLVRVILDELTGSPSEMIELLNEGGQVIGGTTTVGYVPPAGAVAGLAFVRRGGEQPGTALTWRTASGTGPARVW